MSTEPRQVCLAGNRGGFSLLWLDVLVNAVFFV